MRTVLLAALGFLALGCGKVSRQALDAPNAETCRARALLTALELQRAQVSALRMAQSQSYGPTPQIIIAGSGAYLLQRDSLVYWAGQGGAPAKLEDLPSRSVAHVQRLALGPIDAVVALTITHKGQSQLPAPWSASTDVSVNVYSEGCRVRSFPVISHQLMSVMDVLTVEGDAAYFLVRRLSGKRIDVLRVTLDGVQLIETPFLETSGLHFLARPVSRNGPWPIRIASVADPSGLGRPLGSRGEYRVFELRGDARWHETGQGLLQLDERFGYADGAFYWATHDTAMYVRRVSELGCQVSTAAQSGETTIKAYDQCLFPAIPVDDGVVVAFVARGDVSHVVVATGAGLAKPAKVSELGFANPELIELIGQHQLKRAVD